MFLMEILAGKILSYYSKSGVASVEVFDRLETGDIIHIKGHSTDFDQKIESMEINRRQVTEAVKGQIAGIKVADYVRKNDLVYRVEK
jgi:putative protease